MKKGFGALVILLGIFIICLNFVSAAAPTFTAPLVNFSSIFYGNESLNVLFNATNASAFGSYSINDTRFLITQYGLTTNNQTANLTNATSLAFGNYAINVTINVIAGGANSSVMYIVQVNKSEYYDCGVFFNATSGIVYPATFNVSTNCSSAAYTISINVSLITTMVISNNTNINFGAGLYNVNVTRTDTANYTNTFDSQFFTVAKNPEYCPVQYNVSSPQVYPMQFNVSANCTTAFVLARNGTTITNNSRQVLVAGAYNFSVLRTDTQNYSAYYNESQYLLTDAVVPTYNQKTVSNTEVGQSTLFSISATDNSALEPKGGYIFSTNNTWGNETWKNDSFVLFTATPSWANVTKTLNSTVGTTIGYKWYFNDSSGNVNQTANYTLVTIADAVVPTYSGATTSTRIPGRICDFTITVTDEFSLTSNGTTGFDGTYIFSTDNSGKWVNDSAILFTTASSQSLTVSPALNSTSGKIIHYVWYFNDSAGNKISTENYSLTTGYSNSKSTGGSHGGGGVVTPPTNPTEEPENENNTNEEVVACPATSTNENGICKKTLSNGRVADIKVMPVTASEEAIARLGDLGFTITLKEIGKGDNSKPVYELTGKKQGKFLGIFKIMANVKVQVDAETGDVKIIKPWWSFLASGI